MNDRERSKALETFYKVYEYMGIDSDDPENVPKVIEYIESNRLYFDMLEFLDVVQQHFIKNVNDFMRLSLKYNGLIEFTDKGKLEFSNCQRILVHLKNKHLEVLKNAH